MRMTWVIFCLTLTCLPAGGRALADDPEARKIMRMVEDLDDGNNQTAEMEMILIDKTNHRRVRKIASFAKNKGEDKYRLMFFQHPAKVRDSAFLTYDYKASQKDDDQWLFLPALGKTKRIATSNKSGSFMGSDLNYADMTFRNLADYDFYLKKEAVVNGQNVWFIEAIPRGSDVIEETGYTKSVLLVRKDIHYLTGAVHWMKTGEYLKYIDVRKLKKIEGIWVGTEVHISKRRGRQIVHKTIVRLNNVKFNQRLAYDLFTVRRMEKGLF